MPRKRNSNIGDYPLPAGWEVATDYDGKRFYIDHTTKATTWIDPRDRLTKPVSFADCVGDQLPYGWERGYDPLVGIFFVDHIKQTTQLEDPRLQWRETQECMLKDYLAHAHDDLLAKKEIYTVKQERLAIAQEEVNHLQRVNDNIHQQDQWKESRTSLNSTLSISSKYDPDLLKADVEMARKRVGRLKMELDQIHTDVRYTEKGLHTLSAVEQKMGVDQNRYTIEQAHQILNQINDIKKSVCLNEREKQLLLQSLAKLKEEVLMTKTQNGSSPDVSTLSIPSERLSTASQTDLNWEYTNQENRWGEIVRMRLQYDEAKKQVRSLQEQLAKIEEQMVPGQPESDKDRLMLIQEKEQLLRELRSKNPKSLSGEKTAELESRKQQLELDLKQAMELSTKQIAERLRLNDSKSEVLEKLAEATHLTSYLESELKSLSVSTLSVSSGSSRGSLGSLSASSKGSLNSLSLSDLYTYSQSYPDVNLPELHQWVEKLLQGHTTSQLTISSGISPIMEVDTPVDTLDAPITGCTDNIANVAGLAAPSPLVTRLLGEVPARGSVSPGSSALSLSSPLVSPYDTDPPPSYQQHIEKERVVRSSSGSASDLSHSQSSIHCEHINSLSSSLVAGSHHMSVAANAGSSHSSCLQTAPPSFPLYSSSTESESLVDMSLPINSRRTPLTDSDLITNPPLSPISESSSGVCNNTSGVNTRSVSAAVSDESVAGDSGVFEASSKSRSGELDEVLDMSLESAQVQIKLKYEGLDSQLCVGIEQARNLMALAFPDKCHVCIKVMLLPNASPMVFTTRCTCEVNNPKFSELCRVSIPENKLTSKTVQIQVWSSRDGKEEECMGGAQVSLAAFDPKKVKIEWYNVLSFKFMQSETGAAKAFTFDEQKKVVATTAGLIQSGTSQAKPGEEKNDCVNQLLEMSSARLRRSSLGDERSPQQDPIKETRVRSLSFDSSYYRALAQGGGTFSSLKEESSDESTIISSQTSTLTRNQGPDDMLEYPLGHDEEELSDSPEDDEEEDYIGEDAQKMMRLRLSMPENIPEEIEEEFSPDDTIKLATCDKETNTEAKCTLKSSAQKQAPDLSVVAARNSAIRRSQTFSPMGKVYHPDYICKLNRSDSDSSVRSKKPFQRNAVERRSVRLKKMHPTLAKAHSLTSFDRLRSVTSIDLELDLQAYQARLTQLNDEITRLKEIKKKFEEAKAKGDSEPSWFTDNEQLQLFMAEADKALVNTEGKSACKIEERAARLLKQATREAHRLRRSQKINQPDPLSFRAKMAYLTTMSLKIPAVQISNVIKTPPSQQSPSRHRHTHSDPLVGVSQAELRQVIATRGRSSHMPQRSVLHNQQVPLSLPQSQASSHSPSLSLPIPYVQGVQLSSSQHQSRIPNGQIRGMQTVLQSQDTLQSVSQTIPQVQGVSNTVPQVQGVSQTVPQLQSMSQTVPQLQGASMTVPQLQGAPHAVPQSQYIPTAVTPPSKVVPQGFQQLQWLPHAVSQHQGLPQIKSKLSQLPNTSQPMPQHTLAVTGQRRALSFNEGVDRTRATNVHVPTREHSFSHTRSSSEHQARKHEAGEHPLAQARRLQQGAPPLVPATEEQHV